MAQTFPPKQSAGLMRSWSSSKQMALTVQLAGDWNSWSPPAPAPGAPGHPVARAVAQGFGRGGWTVRDCQGMESSLALNKTFNKMKNVFSLMWAVHQAS